MSYLEKSLAPGERLIAHFGLHWTRKWRLWIYLLVAVVFGVVTALHTAWWMATVPALAVALVAALVESIRLRAIELGVTDHRVVFKTGIVGRQTEELRLASIETIDLHQSAWGRILGYGNVVLTGRGESNMLLAGVADPIGVKRAIESAYTAAVENRAPAASAAEIRKP